MKQRIQTPASGVAPDIAAPSELFDNKAARTARPVVPLTENSVNNAAAPRRSWLVVAIAVSAIVGSLTGIAAFSFYQRRQANKVSASEFTAAPAASAGTATPLPAASPRGAESPANVETTSSREKAEASNVQAKIEAEPDAAGTTDARRPALNAVTAPSTAPPGARAERRGSDAAVTKPATETAAERPRANENKERQGVRAVTAVREPATTRNEKPAPAAERPTPERERRVTARRNETPANSSADETDRSSRPGYVDAVRRAIGDRPARRNRRSGDANGERVREIFEGQPPRR